MKAPKTPQAKKRLSLLKDCRNTYGEHDKSSRTSIRWRKSWVNRTYRRDVKQSLDTALDDEVIGDRIIRTNRPQWVKCSDRPLGEVLLRNQIWEVFQQLKTLASVDPEWVNKLAQYLCDRDLKSGRVAVLVKQVRATTLSQMDLTEEDLMLIKDFLCHQQTS